MSRRPLAPGDLLLARLPQLAPPGREQSATPPVLVVALPSRPGAQRYPMIVAAPLTTQLGEWVTAAPDLYPTLNAGTGFRGVRLEACSVHGRSRRGSG